jgi:RNA 3'-terminal phosphate cyclase (ATP)
MITIDGSYGEGGGQILRTSLALAALTGQPLRIENIRAGRKNPGLAAQHLTAVRAAAQVCRAEVEGDALGARTLVFRPTAPPQAGEYVFDVREARQGGSAGAIGLVFQTVHLPLAHADGDSHVTLRGGTHVPWSPPVHYLMNVYLPTIAQLGYHAKLELRRWGWYPVGEGEVRAQIAARGTPTSPAVDWMQRGYLQRVTGIAAVSNLPAHIPQRMADRARALLEREGLHTAIQPRRESVGGIGAGIFLTAEYENVHAGFSALGEKGKASEQVAEEACADLLAHYAADQALDMHLADQVVLPLALSSRPATFTTCRITLHLLTVLHVVRQFLDIRCKVEGEEGRPGQVWIG